MYAVGQKINIGYYGGFRNQILIKTQAEVTEVSGNWVEIKVWLSCGAYRKMFGYAHELRRMEENFFIGGMTNEC